MLMKQKSIITINVSKSTQYYIIMHFYENCYIVLSL